MDTLIERVYESSNFPGVDKLISILQKQHPHISKAYIRKWYSNHLDIQLLHPKQKTKATGNVVSFFPDDTWNIDIFDLSKHHAENGGMKYIFACVDVFTRKLYAEPMTAKDGDNCAGALLSILMEHKVSPKTVLADSDAAYSSKSFSELLKTRHIRLNTVVVGDHTAMGIIDNMAKRLKLIFNKFFIRSKNHQWVSKLAQVVSKYNESPHVSLGGLSPNEAQQEQNYDAVVDLNLDKQSFNKTVSDLKPNDAVRVLETHVFKKGTEQRWSDEKYTVVRVAGGTITISKDDREVKYKRQNLLKVEPD